MAKPTQSAKVRGRMLSFGDSIPDSLFGDPDAIKVGLWDAFAPVWGIITKFGQSSTFDELTYRQMLDNLRARNLKVYMDNDHKTAGLGWSCDEVPALAYYCSVLVTHGGKLFDRVYLGGCKCSDAVSFDAAAHPEGLFGFRCHVTPVGKQLLPNYQALSIHFDPDGRDEFDRPVGQSLICVSAVNAPHLPSAVPSGGKFSRYSMDPETKDLSPELEALRVALGLPEGSSAEAIHGAALAVIRAAGIHSEPDGDEPDGDEMKAARMADEKVDEAMKQYEEAEKEPKRKDEYSRKLSRIVGRLYVRTKCATALSAELGAKGLRKSLAGVATLKSKQTGTESAFAQLQNRIDALESQRKTEEEAAWEFAIKSSINAAGPTNAAVFSGTVGGKALPTKGDGRISEKRGQELFELAKTAKISPEQFATLLPEPAVQSFAKPGARAASSGSTDRMVGSDQADRIREFRDAYQKDTGKKLTYQAAAQALQAQFVANGASRIDYAAAKQVADRLDAGSFVK